MYKQIGLLLLKYWFWFFCSFHRYCPYYYYSSFMFRFFNYL